MSATVEKIKARLSIVEVVGSYLKLEKAGSNFKARCPFHNEKTPSFFVSPTRESFYCFGCNRGGDIFTFIQDIEGVDFLAALKTLAERAGVALESFDRTSADSRGRLYDLLAKAREIYAAELAKQPAVLAYLGERGLAKETITAFGLGYAPAGWRFIYQALTGQGFTAGELEQAGLVIKKESTPLGSAGCYDRFRARIMFPLVDSLGRVVGFSGRVFGAADSTVAKYINSPQTLVYDKSKFLYGLDRAKLEIRRAGRAVLVEGQMDLTLSHQAGVLPAVAVSGTALTEDHLRTLRRLADTLVMAFDGDLAGVRAAKRAIDLALALGFDVRVARLPKNIDPADLIVADPLAWPKLVNEAAHIIDFYLTVLAEEEKDQRQLGSLVGREVLPYVARLASRIDQAFFVTKIKDLLELKEEVIWEELKKLPLASGETEAALTATNQKTRRDRLEEKLFGLLFWQETVPAPIIKVADFKARLAAFWPGEFDRRLFEFRPRLDQLALAAEIAYAGTADLGREAEELCRHFESELLKEELALILKKLRQSEATKNQTDLDLYLKKCQDITNRLNSLK